VIVNVPGELAAALTRESGDPAKAALVADTGPLHYLVLIGAASEIRQ
jgi:hypothetical protein